MLKQLNISGKIPPQAIELEEAVLGALMVDRNAIHDVVNSLSPESFYKEANGLIYEAIRSLYDESKPIDILTVTTRLKDLGNLEKSGGAFYITQLTSHIASSQNAPYHASIITQQFLKREVIRVSLELHDEAYDDTTDPFELLSKADSEISKISEVSIKGNGMLHISDSTKKSTESAMKRELMRKEGKTSGITTGLHELDMITGGLQHSELIILAARPSMGKSSIMVKFAVSAALSGVPACIYSLEMSDEKLADNILLSQCNVDKDKWKGGWLCKDDWSEISDAKQKVDKLPIYIDPNPVVSMRYIRSNSRVMNRKGKCGIIFIDYLQLTETNHEKGKNREQEIAEVSRQAKIISKELNVPVVLLSQLNRKAEDRGDKRPMLSDLRESGAIEQDADLVMFVYRPAYYGIKEDANGNSLIGYGELIISKHRNGACETVRFKHNESMTKIYDFNQESNIPTSKEFEERTDMPAEPNF